MEYVGDLMTSKVFTLRTRDTMSDVRSRMHLARIRHIPVTDDEGRFAGLITHRDLLAFSISSIAFLEQEEEMQKEIDSGIRVSDIMRSDVITTTAQTRLREAAQTLYRNKYGCLPVLDEKRLLIGIITEADFLRLAITLLQDA